MDNHDKAHYGIAGVIVAALAALGGFVQHLAQRAPELVNVGHSTRATSDLWTPLTDLQVSSLAITLEGVKQLEIFCDTPKCDDIADDFASAARTAGAKVVRDVGMGAPPGLSVGAPDVLTARKLADAIEKATDIKPSIAAGKFSPPYVAFGAKGDR